jgi:hypothetical protein
MKYQKTNEERSDLVIDSFRGMDRSAALCGGKGSFELRNLRLMPDGALARRPGLVPLVTFPSTVRSAFCATRGGREEWYAVAGNMVYHLAQSQDGCTPLPIGELGTQTGETSFLCYDGALLMLDGEELYTLTPTEAKPTEAYVPLYGREWQSGDVTTHVVYERPNLLTRRLRLQYRMTASGKILPLEHLTPETVDAIFIDGEPYRGNFSYSAPAKMVAMGDEQKAGSLVEVYLTMAEDAPIRERVVRAKGMAAIDRAECPRVVFYGMPDEGGIWIGRLPDKQRSETMKQMLPQTCMLYVTEGDRVTIGDGVHAVTGAVRHYDRSLVFTAQGTWMSRGEQNEDGTLRFIPVNTTLGCSRAGGAVVLGNRPVTVQGGRVLSWNSDTDERDECNATPISTPIDMLLADRKGEVRAFADTEQGDAWFYTPGGTGRILIYQSEQNAWTTYDGINPQCLALLGGKVGVGMGRTLYLMDEKETADILVDDEHPDGVRVGISAEYQSAFGDFGASERIKRLCRANVVATCDRGRLTLMLQSASGRRVTVPMEGDSDEVSVLQARAPMGRFRFLRVGIASDDDAPLRLHSIRLSARCS